MFPSCQLSLLDPPPPPNTHTHLPEAKEESAATTTAGELAGLY